MGMHFDFRNPFDRTFFTTVNIGDNMMPHANLKKVEKEAKFPVFLHKIRELHNSSTELAWPPLVNWPA